MSDEKKLSERLEEIAKRECWSDDTSFSPYDYSGGNYDDAYYGGNADGRAELAREIKDEIAALEKRMAEAERLHSELLFCVAQKIPGETCHETALRYIKERESREVPGSPQENTHD